MYIFIILLCALIHEIGHLLALTLMGSHINLKITYAGFVLERSGKVLSYTEELIASASGPFANIITALILFNSKVVILEIACQASLALALLNLIPIYSLDGGKIVAALLKMFLPITVAEKISDILSAICLFLIFVISICLMLTKTPNFSLFLLCILIFRNFTSKNMRK